MKVRVVSYHLPHPAGTAAGRQLWALVEAMRADGHDVLAWSWGSHAAGLTAPQWCRTEPFRARTGWSVKARTLLEPRRDIADAGWSPEDDAVVWADDWGSLPAAPRTARTLLVVHYSVAADARVLRAWSPAQLQDFRAERWAVRTATASAALSERVAGRTRAGHVVPATVPVPETPLEPVDAPVALMLADWSWRPNQVALDRLLRSWPDVRRAVPGAELLVAGRNLGNRVGPAVGVRVLGEVRDTVDAMAQAALLAFPCPDTSGPKMKVLDAVLHGLPVVTTPAGVEGLGVAADVVTVAPPRSYTAALVAALADPAGRGRRAEQARAQALRAHAPAVAAESRLALLRAL